jgi:Uri superfamily endonuclease
VLGLIAVAIFVWNTNSKEQAKKIAFEPIQGLGNSDFDPTTNSNTISEDINVVKHNSFDNQANNTPAKKFKPKH